MKACLKKPCFWPCIGALAISLVVAGWFYLWLDTNFGGPICFDWELGAGGIETRRVRTAQHPTPPLYGRRIVFNDDSRMYAVTIDPPSILSFRSPEDALNHEYYAFEHATSLSYQGVIALTENRYTTACQRAFNIEIVNTDGSGRQLLSPSGGSHSRYYPAWSPDGEHIAYLSAYFSSDTVLRTVLHTMDKNGANVHDYTSNVEARIHPILWSPNGAKIAFIGDEPTRNFPLVPFILIADFNDSTVLKLAQTSSLPGWSPDRRIAFVRHRNGFSTIYTIEADGANLQAVRSFPDTLPDLSRERAPLGGRHRLPRGHVSWSRDGSEIRLHQSPFVVVNADGSNLRIMQGQPGALASWSPDESQIAVYAHGDDIRLFTMDPDGSNKRSLARWDSAAGEFTAERVMITIPGFDWESHPSLKEVEQ